MECRHGFISGKVQGVGFRAFAREQAVAAGVIGWARNLPDGRVEAVLQGASDAVERVAAALRRGPPQARVDAVAWDVCKCEPLTGFEIS